MWGDNDVLAFQMGQTSFADQYVSNHDYLGGVGNGAADSSANGRASLGILSAAILGVMFFYIATRSQQY